MILLLQKITKEMPKTIKSFLKQGHWTDVNSLTDSRRFSFSSVQLNGGGVPFQRHPLMCLREVWAYL